MFAIKRHSWSLQVLIRLIFGVTLLLFVSGALLPQLQDYLGLDVIELAENSDTESEEQEEEKEEEVDPDDVFSGYDFKSSSLGSYSLFLRDQQMTGCQVPFEIHTPPPEMV